MTNEKANRPTLDGCGEQLKAKQSNYRLESLFDSTKTEGKKTETLLLV